MKYVLDLAHSAGADIGWSNRLCSVAETYGNMGRVDEALSLVTEAQATVEVQDERYYEPEVHRLRGELLLKQSPSNAKEARSCFEQAIEIARKQNAKSFELRATTSLARLLNKQGHRYEAQTILAEIYYWFTEGFDTADLKDAKALLEELQARPALGEQP
jgi:predicted ATPase